MKIPILQDNFINTGDRTIQTPRLPAPDNSAISKGVQSLGSNISVLFQKKQDADDLTTLIDLDLELDKERLEFEKWKNDPNNQIAGEGRDLTSYWEENARERANRINDKWNSVKMTNETKLRAQSKIDNFANNIITDAYGSAFRQSGQNYKSRLDTMIATGERLNDPSYIERAREYANAGVEKGIFNPLEAELVNESLNGRKQNIEMKNFTNFLESQVVSDNFDGAYETINVAESKGIINKTLADNYRTNIKFKAEYSTNLQKAAFEAETDPVSFLESTKTGGDPTIEFIKSVEGYWGVAKKDGKQISVGYGTKAKYEGERITKEEAEKRLKTELDEAARYVDSYNLPLNPNQRAALISYAYNTGPGSVKNKTGLAHLMTKIDGDVSKIPEALRSGVTTWINPKTDKREHLQGLKNRREKEAKLAEGTALVSSRFKPEDQYKLKITAESAIAKKATNQFNTLKDAISINQLDLISTVDENGEVSSDIDAILNSPDYRELNSDPIMRETIKVYAAAKNNEFSTNDNANYEKTYALITAYKPTEDSSGLRKAQLGAIIESSFSGPYATELKDHLKNVSETESGKKISTIASSAISELNKLAFGDNQGLGAFRTQKMAPAEPGKVRPYWFDIAPKPAQPIVKTADIETVDPITGKVSKRKDVPVPVFEENPELRLDVAEKVADIRKSLEEAIKKGTVKTSEEAIEEMRKLYKAKNGKFNISSKPIQTPATKEQVKSTMSKYLR